MELFQQLGLGFLDILTVKSLLAISLGVVTGITVGALPGLSATMSIAVLTPLTFLLAPQIGIALLLGVYVGGIYGGSITAILLRTPGTPSSIATTFDGYPLAQQGNAGKALYLALVASVIGGLISAAVLIVLAPQIARFALKFGPVEYFGLTIFGISIIASVSGENLLKGLIAGIIGILLSTVGMDQVTGVARFTFGTTALLSGFNLIPVLIGIFAVSEILYLIKEKRETVLLEEGGKIDRLSLSWREFKEQFWNIIRSSFIGTFVGIVPGTGGGIAAFLAYDVAKRQSRHPERFGTGSLEGVASAEASNNATTGGALVPMLTLGIPGDPSTAVLISAFMIQGMQPGPLLLQTDSRTVFSLFAGLVIANILLFGFGLIGIRAFSKVVHIPIRILAPSVLVLCFVGSYSIANSLLDVAIMLGMGVVGYLMRKYGFPGAPLVIGLILGPVNEAALRRALSASRGNWLTFLENPIFLVFFALTIISFLLPVIRENLKRTGNRVRG